MKVKYQFLKLLRIGVYLLLYIVVTDVTYILFPDRFFSFSYHHSLIVHGLVLIYLLITNYTDLSIRVAQLIIVLIVSLYSEWYNIERYWLHHLLVFIVFESTLIPSISWVLKNTCTNFKS